MSNTSFITRRRFSQTAPTLAGVFTLGCGHDARTLVADEEADAAGGETGGKRPTEGTGGAEADGTGGAQAGGAGGGTASSGGSNHLGGQGGAAPTCGDWTASNIEGPFFLPNSPERTNLRATNSGVLLVVSGRVLGLDCSPIADAVLDFWQADDAGAYDNVGTNLRGFQRTNADGSYALQTILPGRYLNGAQYRPAHLHVKVTANGQTLTTQLYFAGDPYNDVDAFIESSLIMDVQTIDGDSFAKFDFVVP